MISGLIDKKEREVSLSAERFGGMRKNRYIEREEKEAVMIKVLEDIINHGINGRNISDSTKKIIKDAAIKARDLGWSEGLLAKYKNEYVIVFLNVEGLDHCALKITHNESERKLVNEFYMSSSDKDRLIFSLVCLNLLRDKQRVAVLHRQPTYGMIYSNYPDNDEPIDTFVQYINIVRAGKIVNVDSIYAVKSAIERGCSEEEILAILPRGTENKFFNVTWTDFELAQMDALMPNISAQA